MNNNDIVPAFDDEKCDGLEITLRRIEALEGGLLLLLTGSVDNDSSQCFRQRVNRAIDAGFILLIFDLGGVAFISGGSGLGSLTGILKILKQRGGNVALTNLQPKILEHFQLLGFSQFFNVRDTLAEAIAALCVEPAATQSSNDAIVPEFDDEHDDALAIGLRRIGGLEGGLELVLAGYIDNCNNAAVHRRLQKVIGAGFRWLVLDLQRVNYLSETGLGVLLSVKKAANLHGGDIAFSGVQPKVFEIFRLLGVSEFFRVRDTLDEALAAIRSAAAEPPTGNNAIVTGFDWEPCGHLSVSLKKIDGLGSGLLVTLSGYLNGENSESFLRRLTRAVDAGFDRLVLDLRDYFYTTDPGLASITGIRGAARAHGGDLAIINLPPMENEVFRLLGFDKTFTLRDTLDEAIAFFTSAGTPRTPPEFPVVFRCPICSHNVRAAKPGRFRCRKCRTILAVDTAAEVIPG